MASGTIRKWWTVGWADCFRTYGSGRALQTFNQANASSAHTALLSVIDTKFRGDVDILLHHSAALLWFSFAMFLIFFFLFSSLSFSSLYSPFPFIRAPYQSGSACIQNSHSICITHSARQGYLDWSSNKSKRRDLSTIFFSTLEVFNNLISTFNRQRLNTLKKIDWPTHCQTFSNLVQSPSQHELHSSSLLFWLLLLFILRGIPVSSTEVV